MVVDLLKLPPLVGRDLREDQVFLDRHAGDDTAILGHKLDARLTGLPGFHRVHGLTFQPDLAMSYRRVVGTCDGAQSRGLASPVASQKRQDLALLHLQRDALHDIAFAVIGMNITQGEKRNPAPVWS